MGFPQPAFEIACYSLKMGRMRPSLQVILSSDRVNPTSPCPVCQKVSLSKYLTKRDRLYPERAIEEHHLDRCNMCHLVKILPEHSPDEIKAFFQIDYMAYQPHRKIERTSFRQKLREAGLPKELGHPLSSNTDTPSHMVTEKEISLSSSVFASLDIGPGSGEYLNLLKELGWDTYGLEMNEQAYATMVQQGHQGYLGMIEEAASF